MSSGSAVLTFLFTDVEGSTRRWEADAEAMRTELSAHDDVLRDAISAHGGMLFKHTGDGVCAVFGSPRAAVDAAIAAQRSLDLPVRMGLATGEAEARDGDYFGPALNRAARVMAAGHGGQILLDGQTAGLLAGVGLRDLGARRLRDISQPVHVFQARADGLAEDFAPLRTDDPVAGNLRIPPTACIGRDDELSRLCDELRMRRLVTLTGVGGVGKTRLALEAVARSAGDYSDGVWVIELAAVGDGRAVPEAVAAILGIHHQPGMTTSQSVAAALEGRFRLLLFDNCEHVVDSAADVIGQILDRSATVRIVATSREGLQVPDERLWPVRPLDVRTAAPALFFQRAGDLDSVVSPADEADNAVVSEICRRLDGIPLAIELAASRLQSMTLTELRDRLDDRFRLLVGSRRNLDRHQTLRHTVQWSFDLLDGAERQLLQRCSVFAGGFDLDAAAAVSGDDDYATLNVLDSLVRKSLVVADRTSDRTRFTTLETIRQFSEEELAATGTADQTRRAHAQHFAHQAMAIFVQWDGPRQRESYRWFTAELANLRAAFRWAIEHRDVDDAAAIAVVAAYVGFWVEQLEPVAWAEELLAPARELGHRRLPQLLAMATQCYALGRLNDALGYADECRAVIDAGRYDPLPYDLESWLGGPYIWTGATDQWLEVCRTALARATDWAAPIRANLTLALSFTEQVADALAVSHDLLDFVESTDNPRAASFTLLAYGYARRNVDPPTTLEAFRRGMEIARASGNLQVESHFAGNLALHAAFHGEPSDALEHLRYALRFHFDSGSFSLMLSPLGILGVTLFRLGRREPAAVIHGFAGTPFMSNQREVLDLVAQLRAELGDDTYERYASQGASKTNAEIANYALEQIDLARAQLE